MPADPQPESKGMTRNSPLHLADAISAEANVPESLPVTCKEKIVSPGWAMLPVEIDKLLWGGLRGLRDYPALIRHAIKIGIAQVDALQEHLLAKMDIDRDNLDVEFF